VRQAALFLVRPWRASGASGQRLGLLLIVTLVWDLLLTADKQVSGKPVILMIVLTVVGYPILVLFCVLALRQPTIARLFRWRPERILQVAPLLVVIASLTIIAEAPNLLRPSAPIADDVTASIICAARDAIHGHDPYSTPELACFRSLRASPNLGTPLQRGLLQHQLSYPSSQQLSHVAAMARRHGGKSSAFAIFGYPPMAFAWMIPAAWSNHSGWVAFTLICAVIWLLLAGIVSAELWPAVVLLLLLQFGDGSVLGAATQGDGEFFAYAAMTLSLMLIDRRRFSSILLALAMATNPLAWGVAVGYAFYTRTLPGFKERIVWTVGALLITVGPWLVFEPHALRSMVGLITQPNFGFGIGLINAFGPAPSPVLRHVMFAVLALSFLGLCAFTWRRREWLPILPVVAVAFMWLGWRSDVNYLAQVFPLAVGMAVGLHRLNKQRPLPLDTRSSELAGIAGAGAAG
jgi:hypothetical protein